MAKTMATCKDCIHYEVCKTEKGSTVFYREGLLESTYNQVDKLCGALFKDKSRFVELPCKAGDRVYAAFPKAKAAVEYVIVSIWVEEAGVSVRAVDTTFFTYGFFMAQEFGKKLFFTKEEAEQALKEREIAE